MDSHSLSVSAACPNSVIEGAPRVWLVTGVAGFIGSHLLEALLRAGRQVVGLDNFVTGDQANLDDVRRAVTPAQWAGFDLVEGDIRDPAVCARAAEGVDVVSHQAGLNSVPRSVSAAGEVTHVNVTGFVNVVDAAAKAGVSRFVYASSSSVYGDAAAALRQEDVIGAPLSPYAASKQAKEAFAAAYHHLYGLPMVGLRYFNVFGPRQNPHGPYSAVVPRWITALLDSTPAELHGDGTQSRDFTFVGNVVAANLRAATAPDVGNAVVNVGAGRSTSLRELFGLIRAEVATITDRPETLRVEPVSLPKRPGDVDSSVASVDRAQELLGYRPLIGTADGVNRAVRWFAAARGSFASAGQG